MFVSTVSAAARFPLILLAFAALMLGPAAHAAKVPPIEKVGISSFDAVFVEADALDQKIRTAQNARKQGRTSLADAMEMKEGATLAESIAELKQRANGKVKVALKGSTPTLEASDAVPSDVAAGINAANLAMAGYVTAIDSLVGVPAASQKLIKQTSKFPSNFYKELGGFKLSKWKTYRKQLKKVKSNVGTTKSIPKRATTVSGNINGDLTLIVKEFGGSWPPQR